jgi:hypothetical protein
MIEAPPVWGDTGGASACGPPEGHKKGQSLGLAFSFRNYDAGWMHSAVSARVWTSTPAQQWTQSADPCLRDNGLRHVMVQVTHSGVDEMIANC